MKEIEIANELDCIKIELDQTKSLLSSVLENYFEFSKADYNSDDEKDRLNAYLLAANYDTYSDLIRIAWDRIHRQGRELNTLSEKVHPSHTNQADIC